MRDWLGQVVRGEGDAKRAKAGLLAAAERLDGFGAWAWDTGSDQLAWSDGTQRILGSAPHVAGFGETLRRAHPEDRSRLAAALDRAREGEPCMEIHYRVMLPTGAVRFLHAVLVGALKRDGSSVLYGLLRDLTGLQAVEREVAAHVAVSSVLRAWEEWPRDGSRLLGALSEALGFTQAALWAPVGEHLEPRLWWAEQDERSWQQWLEGRRVRAGQGLVGSAWESREPVVLAAIRREPGPSVLDYCARHGFRGAVALPVIGSGRVLAVITMIGREELALTDRLRAVLVGIGHEVGASLALLAAELTGSPLTARERELLQLAAEGLSGPQIARRLTLSPATVKTHFENIYAKYGVPDRVAAVAKAMREGLIS